MFRQYASMPWSFTKWMPEQTRIFLARSRAVPCAYGLEFPARQRRHRADKLLKRRIFCAMPRQVRRLYGQQFSAVPVAQGIWSGRRVRTRLSPP